MGILGSFCTLKNNMSNRKMFSSEISERLGNLGVADSTSELE